MIELRYRLRFNTPAFLGNAEQTAQWRTPPVKALLRQWWRVAYAADYRGTLDVGAMRRAEGRLFGVAADRDGDSRQSRVRLRLDRWDVGRMKTWSGDDTKRVTHPEVRNANGGVVPVGAHLYMGYGPLVFKQGATALKSGAAIQSGEDAEFRLAFPDDADAPRLRTALQLMHLYGALGGRSRNGWGSFGLEPLRGTPVFATILDARLTLPWRDALKQDWPQAIGTDPNGALIWQTNPDGDWKVVMRQLAEIKIDLRTQFGFTSGKNAPSPEARHWLSYPVTNHSVQPWGNNARLPNSLRFKVRADSEGKLHGVVFHVPCLPPPAFQPDPAAIVRIWQQVHTYLDGLKGHASHPLDRVKA